jgi:hypothetical protein
VADLVIALLALAGITAVIEWRRRRHARAWQFSLGELACLITCVAGALGWWTLNGRAARAEAAIITENRLSISLGSPERQLTTVTHNYVGPKWLRHLLGEKQWEDFERVTRIDVQQWDCPEPPDELSLLTCIKSLRIHRVARPDSLAKWLAATPGITNVEVGLARTDILPELCRTCRITSLDLANWPVTELRNDDLAVLKLAPTLQKVDLTATYFTDKAIQHLVDLPNLHELILTDTRVTDAGLAELSQFKTIQKLDLSELMITDDGLSHLATMPNLTDLTVDSPAVTDVGLAQLGALPNLKTLDVRGVQFRDEALGQLQSIKSLRKLACYVDRISPEALARFHAALPQCTIEQ